MRLLPFLLLGALFAGAPLRACSVPVFRYALEHWDPDAFQAVVFHRGPLQPAEEALVRDLGADGLAGRQGANLTVTTVDLDANPAPEMLELARASAGDALPALIVRFPRTAPSGAIIWSGPLSADGIATVLDSPARKEVVERLGGGQSAVWLLLESGNAEKDAAAAKQIETRLAELGRVLSLPALDPQDIVNGLVSVPHDQLRLEFSLLRVARTDPAEGLFVRMLLGTESDLAEVEEPIAFPIFGRGRALYALAGAGIKRETIDEAATFLIGKCSCQVKEQNPGVDLLLAADWDGLIKAQNTAAPDLPKLSELAESAPVTVSITGEEPAPASMSPKTFFLAGGVFAALLGAGVLLRRKK